MQLSRRILSVAMRFTVGGDTERDTCGANAVAPLTFGTRAALHEATRVYAGIFFSLHMFGQLLPVTERLLQFAEILRFYSFH